MTDTPAIPEDDEISLLDLLQIIVDNLRLLILGPLADKDPQFAAELANAYVQELQKLLARLAVTEAQQRRVFFEKQLLQAKDSLTAAEQALKASGISDNLPHCTTTNW